MIQKWSLKHLGGIDLTALGPPAKRNTSTTHHTPPFKFMFKSPFAKNVPLATVLISDTSNLASGLAVKLEKMIAESASSDKKKVDELAESFQRMIHDSTLVTDENKIDIDLPEKHIDEGHGSDVKIIDANPDILLNSDTNLEEQVVGSAPIMDALDIASNISPVQEQLIVGSLLINNKTSDLTDKLEKMLSDAAPSNKNN